MKKFLCFAAIQAVFLAGCTSTSPTADWRRGGSDTAATNAGVPPAPGAASRPPRLTVGTSYPDTQLILPWFLNDVIDFVNYR